MPRPTKHPKTGIYRIRCRVPKDLQGIIGSAERVISLATKNPEEAKRRAPAAEQKIAEEFATARVTLGPMRRLTHQEITALCGNLYRETVGHWEEDPGTAEDWKAYAGQLHDELERDETTGDAVGPSRADLADAKRITQARGIPADADSIRRLASAFYRTKLKAAETLARRADGDYSPDRHLETFPAVEAEKPQTPTDEPLTGESLLADWSVERTPAASALRTATPPDARTWTCSGATRAMRRCGLAHSRLWDTLPSHKLPANGADERSLALRRGENGSVYEFA